MHRNFRPPLAENRMGSIQYLGTGPGENKLSPICRKKRRRITYRELGAPNLTQRVTRDFLNGEVSRPCRQTHRKLLKGLPV